MRLVIGGPTRETVPASFAVDLANLVAYTKKYTDWAVWLRFVAATYVHAGREEVVYAANQVLATHILWLDTDMNFPETLAVRLARHQQLVVACNYAVRNREGVHVAMRNGQRVTTTPQSTGLEPVDSVGMGAMLMATDVVLDLPRPMFAHGRNELTNADVGEDVMFCRALRRAGVPIYIDHDLSKEMGHVGQHTYRTLASTPVAV